jgi:hypothetical protein
MRIRHTVIFTFYPTTTEDEKQEVIARLQAMGEYLTRELRVTNWVVARHIPETFNARRSHLLQDGVFPDLETLHHHSESEAHHHVVELTPKVCDWMTVDTVVPDN